MVVAPTIAAVGLSFYSYGFPLVGTCLEIGVVQILLVILFSLVSSVAIFLPIMDFDVISFVVLLLEIWILVFILSTVPSQDICYWSSHISHLCGKFMVANLCIQYLWSRVYLQHMFCSGHLMHKSCESNGLSLLNCQVPLGLAITWAAAFLLTETGAYNYKECDVNVPVSNIISEHCRKHVSRMKQCRVDSSHALKSSPWFRFPYPLQWGTPVFHWKMAVVMCVVSVIASVDSVCLIFLLLLTILLKIFISWQFELKLVANATFLW